MNCKATLPSAECAFDFIEGKPGSGAGVIGTTLFRACLIGLGAYLVGVRDRDTLLKVSLGGAASVEAFVIGWVYMQKRGLV